MKTKFLAFFRNYHAALRSQLMQPSRDADVRAARKLGLRALELGLSTHDVARIHEEALLRLVPLDTSARTRNAFIRGGVAFFGEASETIEESRHGARTATARLKSIIGTLTQRTSELAVFNKKLIQDDGRGFQMEEIAVAESGMHLGLLGMRERVEMVGGTFCVESAPGKSTTIRVEVPYRHVRKRPLKQSKIPALECP